MFQMLYKQFMIKKWIIFFLLKINKKISKERADAVRTYLIEQGIAEDRITSEGYGYDVPIAENETEEGRAKNRRGEFKIMDK